MRLLDTSPADRVKIKNILSIHYSRSYDPNIGYVIDAIAAPEIIELKDVILELAGKRSNIQFSAISASRGLVATTVMQTNKFPAGEFCAPTPRIVMQFLRGHRVPVRKGVTGSIGILLDRSPTKASSPSVVNLGLGADAERLGSYLKTSKSVELIAVIKVTLTSVERDTVLSGEQKAKLKGIRRRGLKRTDLGSEVDDKTYRQVRKLRDKRMDNYGMKDDF